MKQVLLLTLLASFLAAGSASATPACGEEWGDLDSVDLDASDLATYGKTPGGEMFYGRPACISGGEENLIAHRWKVEHAFRVAVEKNYATHARYGQPDEGDYVCRFEDTRGLDTAMSFERPAGDSELHKSYRKKICGGGQRFGFAEISLAESVVKLRCGSRELMATWERQCGGREPSSVKAVKTTKRAPAKKKRAK